MTLHETRNQILSTARKTDWEPDHEYSVFNQYDHSFYDSQRGDFLWKYRVLFAVAAVLKPETLTELGVGAGSSFDAFNAGNPIKDYTGYDLFPVVEHESTKENWSFLARASEVTGKRGVNARLVKGDLRNLKEVQGADLIFIDGGKGYRNSYRDLWLAFKATPRPKFILVDDYHGEQMPAFQDVEQDFDGLVKDVARLDYTCGGGLLVELNAAS